MGLFDKLKKAVAVAAEPNKPQVTVTTVYSTSDSQDEIIPIEKRIKNQKPVCDGLHPHEVLVLSYAPTYYKGKTDFPGFWWYQYGIKDVAGILDSLKNRGYINIGTTADAIKLEKLTLIKEELQNRGLKVSGKKADLVARLVENVDENELAAVFTKRPYALTENGETVLNNFEWIPYIHKHAIEDLNIWNLTDLMQSSTTRNYRDDIWGYLNNQSMRHAKNRNLGLYRNCRFEMSEFVAEEGKLQNAFQLLCEVIAYDLIGAPNNYRPQDLRIHLSYLFPYDSSLGTLAPGVVSRAQKLAESFGWTEQEFRDQIETEIKKISVPFTVFTPSECADIVLAEIKTDKTALKAIYSKAEKRMN